MQCERDLRGDKVADENANCVGDSLADLSALLWIQNYPPTVRISARALGQRSL